MEITDVRVRRIESEGKLRAYATITFDNQFVIHNLKVIDGKSGLFVAMPSRKTKSGEFKDVAHPISSEFRNMMQQMILAAYEQAPPVQPGEAEQFDETE
ncbi:MAG: septation regulator SpoVG [Sphaerochaetaceae bacterium]|mgnify:CR=1 FL=1|jgi:stage V sporulation protein G|nr:septation regulator SpoVG [Sphaerochaetaceae bacterium]NLO61050.1 septation regulator SpoVG [Spirochaetales bacterium]MDD2405784.1 septation regulator SpoVG [Sphaerochaetaceae bacterium]MDD3670696.1 septation regulator SpoVG [Sphaerochaetaceae bacterium]MDD4259288.1 septation regulator SpoVG [Sphaerochaetaceae bacterium]